MLRWARVLPLLVIIFSVVLPAMPVKAAEEIQLGWRDYGMDLAPGYRYTVMMESHKLWTGAVARAKFAAGPLMIEMDLTHLTIKVNERTEFDQDIGTEDVTITIYIDHDGSGTVEVSGYGSVATFYIDRAYRITVFEETVSFWRWSVSSSVEVSRQALPSNSGDYTQTIGETNTGSGSSLMSRILDALGASAVVAIVIILVLLGFVVFLIALTQSAARGWITNPFRKEGSRGSSGGGSSKGGGSSSSGGGGKS